MSNGSPVPLALRLFGPFELRLHGRPVSCLRSRKGQWLLALLVLRTGRDVERDWLAGTLWPDSPEAAARANLRSSLKELRRALGDQAGRLRSPTLRTLSLDLTEAAVDLLAFDVAIGRGDAEALADAVSLYRGPLLEGCVEAWAFQERQSREQAYLGALETLAAQALAAGEAGEAERHLRVAVGVDPLRECAQRGLMRVLAAGGNYAGALLVYRELRLLFQREMNTQPDEETRALFERLRGAARDCANAPLPLLPERSRGPSPERPADAYPSNLPIPPTPLLGREQERATARQMLCPAAIVPDASAVRLLTFTGPPGTGKTRLALQVAADLQEEFEDGVFFVPLAPICDPDLLLSTIAQTLAVREAAGRPLAACLQEHLRAKRLLLVLDNFEQLLPAAPLLAELAATTPGLTLIVTSRAALRLRGEQQFPVPPLPVPDPARLPPLPLLGRYAAVELFVQRASNVVPGFALTEENGAAVAAICARLDGLPLAIELAAGRMKLFSPEALLGRLASRLALLTGGARDLPPRQQTLRDAIAWSYDLLPESEKRLLRRLSVFAGGCGLEAAEAVCGEPNDPSVLPGLASLVDQSLIQREVTVDGETRITLLETIREYGRECLAASGEEEALRRRHARFFLEWVSKGDQNPLPAKRLEQEIGNVRAALTWAEEQGEAEAGLRAACASWPIWHAGGYVAEGRQWLMDLLALPSARLYPSLRGSALSEAGALACVQGDYEVAQRLLEESLAIRTQQGGQKGPIADTLLGLGRCFMGKGDLMRARSYLEEALANFRELAHRCETADALGLLGSVLRLQGAYDRAAEIYEESRALYERLGKREALVARELRNLGHVAQFQGDIGRAKALLRKSLAILQERGSGLAIPGCLAGLAGVATAEGEPERGARLLGAAQGLIEAMAAVWEPAELAEYERHRSAIFARLDEAAFAAAWAAGRAMLLEDAPAYALKGLDDEAAG